MSIVKDLPNDLQRLIMEYCTMKNEFNEVMNEINMIYDVSKHRMHRHISVYGVRDLMPKQLENIYIKHFQSYYLKFELIDYLEHSLRRVFEETRPLYDDSDTETEYDRALKEYRIFIHVMGL